MRVREALDLLQWSVGILPARSHHQNHPVHPAVRTKDVEISQTDEKLLAGLLPSASHIHIDDPQFRLLHLLIGQTIMFSRLERLWYG
jgi:hypothetical protein